MLRAIFFGRSAVSSSSQFPGELGISHLVCGPDISMFSILASNSFSLWAVSKATAWGQTGWFVAVAAIGVAIWYFKVHCKRPPH